MLVCSGNQNRLAISLSTLFHIKILLVRHVLVNLRMQKLNCNSIKQMAGFLRYLSYLINFSGNLHSVQWFKPYRLFCFDISVYYILLVFFSVTHSRVGLPLSFSYLSSGEECPFHFLS